jgi:D-sedoheptulose 7-phosphate isomerase
LNENIELLKSTIEGQLDAAVGAAIEALSTAARRGSPILVCGNGGSAADAMHIAGELVGRFMQERKALNVTALSANPAILTAWANDYEYRTVFARQVEAYGQPGGVLWGISTSGNSGNVIEAFGRAKSLSMTRIALTGEGGGQLAADADVLIAVPSRSTPRIQEIHVALYHFICAEVESRVAAA